MKKFRTIGSERRKRLSDARLCLLFTPSLCRGNPFDTLREALRAGIDLVQIRAKEAGSKELLDLSFAARRLVGARALLLVNDRADIARLAGADGVHLGQDDLPPEAAREILGPEALVGLSTHSREQVESAKRLPVDYLGFGPIFPTATKGYAAGIGPRAAKDIEKKAGRPVFLIGGIDAENVRSLPRGSRVALSSSVLSSEDPAAAVRLFLRWLRDR